MARPRADTIPKEPHSVSLKVLRLSRPALSLQHPLPYITPSLAPTSPITLPPTASLSYPSSDPSFILSPNLSLPPSFGSAHVGETFSCSLCANNELSSTTTNPSRSVTNVQMLAEMQTPSTSVPLTLTPEGAKDNPESLPGSSIQRIIHFSLTEEGTHVLAVNVSYTETPLPASSPTTTTSSTSQIHPRTRSFRKLYQFLASPLLSIRTKATDVPPLEIPDKSLGPYGRVSLLRYVLEAQLENVSDGAVVLEVAKLNCRKPFEGVSLNWDAEDSCVGVGDGAAAEKGRGRGRGEREMDDGVGGGGNENGKVREGWLLNPRDVLQLAFLVTQSPGVADGLEKLKANLKRDGRTVLGQLSIQWRGGMGGKGSLSSGGLMTRRR